ncbi:MAG TPA: hypothetical protein VH019_05730 [Rhizomicrobium sp.]|jgi:hypothetical protein|nr:hypothetical protein [Rhizomicrobium sp.]
MREKNAGKWLAAAACWLALGTAHAQPVQPLPRHTAPVPLDAPSVTIGNGTIQARIYLPDPGRGFYRGTRFDQSGVIGSLTVGQQDFYGPWFDRVSPEIMDYAFTPEGVVGGPDSAISGPVEEFAPVGFDQARPGGTFIKIGVGLLKKPDDAPYNHYRIYDIADAGIRKVGHDASSITFTQDVAGAFRYQKIIRLTPGRAEMRIEHVLTNGGNAQLTTTVYDHNFLKLSPGNADVAVTLPFPVTPDKAPDPALVRIDGNRIAFQRPLADKEVVSFLIQGYGASPSDYDIRVDDTKTGAGMRVTGDNPLVKLNLWSIRTAMAVEPTIAIDLAPGASKHWTYVYTYKAR